MSQIYLKILSTCVLLIMVIAAVLFLPSSDTCVYGAEKKEVPAKKQPETDSYIMEMEFTGNRPDTRIARTDDSEIMIAFKMKAQGDFFRFGQGKQKFAKIRYEKLPGGAEAVFLKTHDIIDTYETRWLEEGKTLQISVTTTKKKAIEQSEKKTQPVAEKNSVHQRSTEDEFVRSIKELPCFSGGELGSAYAAISNENWESASEITDEYIADNGADGKCSDAAAFLKAYIFYRTMGKENSAEARRLFQEAMMEYPDSPYTPYSALFLGEIELSLTGYATAAGYFSYILNEFPDFLAKPQAIYGAAIANVQLDNLVAAYKSLMDLASNYPESQYNQNAAYQQGIIYFKRGDYQDALRRFEAHIEKNKGAVLDSPELLYYMGSSAYHSGNSRKAIDYLSKAYNLFPEIKEPEILFSRIADSYIEEGQLEKARKLYELVRSRYSGTDGFAVSSVRLAGITDDPEERESIYQEVVDEFPQSPLSKLSMLKIARSRYDAGNYSKSIEILEKLLADKPGSTQKEADALLRLAQEKIFDSMAAEGRFFDIVTMYEAKHKSLAPYITPGMRYTIGKSYLKLKLYEPAYQHITEAGKAFGNRKKPDGFDYSLAVALHETGRAAEAQKLLANIANSNAEASTDALKRLAEIRISEGRNDEALNAYREIASRSRTPHEKAVAILDQITVLEKTQDNEGLLSTLKEAEKILSDDDTEQDRNNLIRVLKKLGETELKQKNLFGASAAFEKALKLKKEEDNLDEISFLLADCYNRLGKTSEANEIFRKISEGDNDFWAKLAKDRLDQAEFLEKIKNPEKKIASQ